MVFEAMTRRDFMILARAGLGFTVFSWLPSYSHRALSEPGGERNWAAILEETGGTLLLEEGTPIVLDLT